MALERESGKVDVLGTNPKIRSNEQNETEALESGETGTMLKELSLAKILGHFLSY